MALLALVTTLALAGIAWNRQVERRTRIRDPFERSEQAVQLLQSSVAAVPHNSFDARLRIRR